MNHESTRNNTKNAGNLFRAVPCAFVVHALIPAQTIEFDFTYPSGRLTPGQQFFQPQPRDLALLVGGVA